MHINGPIWRYSGHRCYVFTLKCRGMHIFWFTMIVSTVKRPEVDRTRRKECVQKILSHLAEVNLRHQMIVAPLGRDF